MASSEILERIWSKVERGDDTECWPWTGFLRRGRPTIGICVVGSEPRHRSCDRILFEHFLGSIPDKFTVGRSCGNVCCLNVRHFLLKRQGYEGGNPSKSNLVRKAIARLKRPTVNAVAKSTGLSVKAVLGLVSMVREFQLVDGIISRVVTTNAAGPEDENWLKGPEIEALADRIAILLGRKSFGVAAIAESLGVTPYEVGSAVRLDRGRFELDGGVRLARRLRMGETVVERAG